MTDVAVIIPTYNRAALIAAALDSVVAQTILRQGKSIEVAIVDDGSTDNTPAVVQPYLDKHRSGPLTIRYTRLPKQGVVTARNTAIAQTIATHIAFLDSDDYWHPDKLEKQLELMDRDPAVGLVHTSFRYVNEQGEFTDADPAGQRLDNPCIGSCVDVLLYEFLVIFSSAVVRRSIVNAAAKAEPHGLPFDPRWTNAQDYDLVLRCARLCKFAYVAEPLTLYRLHASHGAMSNLKRAYGFHSKVQLDFVNRYGRETGLDETEAKRRAARFVYGRAEAAFWRRQFPIVKDLCGLARELEFSDARFDDLAKKASRPQWVYKVKDQLDRITGRGKN